MPNIRVITGTFASVLNRELFYGLDKKGHLGMMADSPEPSGQILKDLGRQTFVPSNGRTYDDYLATWLSPNVSRAYSQGLISSQFYYMILGQLVTRAMGMDSQEEFDQLANKDPLKRFLIDIVKDLDTRVDYMVSVNKGINFGFYDDDGVPCGVCIHYSIDSQFWTASIIRNTTAEPEDREVMIISPEDIVKAQSGDQLVSSANAVNSFFKFLNSKQIQKD
ncbi:hypothetical protein [Legionella tunisiensis]|uniref:hypothetical protein n=1 Tax=Legionella tunisiensis TaxID=1034944 RepID=UPI0002D56F8E|nr:hypothetical protein [Legionella tunisiensis]